jgi:hypothetical protein
VLSAAETRDDCLIEAAIIDADGQGPLPGAEVMLRLRKPGGLINMGTEPEPLAKALADKDGAVRFGPLALSESYYVVVRFPGFQGTFSEVRCDGGGATVQSIALREFQTVSLVQLIADPAHWNGRYVQIIGFLNLEFEGDALYLHREDWKKGLTKNGLWVDVTSEQRATMSPLRRRYVIIAGVFDGTRHGHGALFSGTLREVSRCDPWR